MFCFYFFRKGYVVQSSKVYIATQYTNVFYYERVKKKPGSLFTYQTFSSLLQTSFTISMCQFFLKL